ncbi:unnamed protein product [Pylaiella littoralis]
MNLAAVLMRRRVAVATRMATRPSTTAGRIVKARAFSAAVGTQLATPAPEAGNPRQGHGAFDTFRFVTELEGAGVPREQAIAMMEQVLLAISEANTRQIALVATKQDLLSLQSEINEKVFSSTLRYDLAQRHLKELMQRDLTQVKADVRSEEKFDFAKLHDEITELEKRVFQRRETDEVLPPPRAASSAVVVAIGTLLFTMSIFGVGLHVAVEAFIARDEEIRLLFRDSLRLPLRWVCCQFTGGRFRVAVIAVS